MSLNLASRPFVNRRPLRRIGITLWVLVAILALVNGFLYLDYFRGSGKETRERFLDLQSQIRDEKGRIETLEMQLGRYDPEAQAEHVGFLNDRIAERAFGWSRLFDHLVDVLPLRVRLSNLTPQRPESSRRTRDVRDKVRLAIRGLAEQDTHLYELVDRLWAHPAFENPKLSNEYLQDGTIIFQLTVIYDPSTPTPAVDSELGGEPMESSQEPAEEEAQEAAEPAAREEAS